MRRNKFALLLACSALLATSTPLVANFTFALSRRSQAAVTAEESADASEYRRDLRRVEELREAKDLDGMVRLADEIQLKWGEKVKPYAYLMAEVCGALSSYDFGDERQYLYARRYTKAALEKADHMPIELEVRLVSHLQGHSEYLTGLVKEEYWPQDRSERVKYWLHAWERLEKNIDRNFDLNAPGNQPRAVNAPGARRDSEADEAAAKARATVFNEQYKLRQLDEFFPRLAEQYIIQAYSRPPFNSAELRQHLNAHGVGADAGRRILGALPAAVR